jgi:hypothetical protein
VNGRGEHLRGVRRDREASRPRLQAFVRTGHYVELTAILATARATVDTSRTGASAHDMYGYNAASSALRHLRITPVTPPDSTREEMS